MGGASAWCSTHGASPPLKFNAMRGNAIKQVARDIADWKIGLFRKILKKKNWWDLTFKFKLLVLNHVLNLDIWKRRAQTLWKILANKCAHMAGGKLVLLLQHISRENIHVGILTNTNFNFNMILVPHHTKNRRTRVEVSQSSSDEQARSQLWQKGPIPNFCVKATFESATKLFWAARQQRTCFGLKGHFHPYISNNSKWFCFKL